MMEGKTGGGRKGKTGGGGGDRDIFICWKSGDGGMGERVTTAQLPCYVCIGSELLSSVRCPLSTTIHSHCGCQKEFFRLCGQKEEGEERGTKHHMCSRVIQLRRRKEERKKPSFPPFAMPRFFLCGFSAGNGSLSPKCLAMTPSPSAAAIHVCVCSVHTQRKGGKSENGGRGMSKKG